MWRGTAGAALVLVVLGTAWPGRLPGAAVGADIALVCAGALLGRALLVDPRGPLREVIGTGLRLLVVPLVVLVGVAIAVQRWADVREWEVVLREVRVAVLASANVREVATDSPVASFWVVALLVHAALLVLVLRWVAQAWTGIATVVLLLSVASFVWWAFDPASHLGARFWPIGAGILVALAVARRGEDVVPRSGALVAWAAVPAVAAVAVLGSGEVMLTMTGAVIGVVLVVDGLAPGSPAALLGDRLAAWFALAAWTLFCVAGPAVRLAPEVLGRDLGLRDRAELLVLLGVAALVAAVVILGLRRLVAHAAAWAILAAGLGIAAFLVTGPGMDRVEAIEADVARVQEVVTADLPACFGAAEIAARLDGEPCANPDLAGTTSPPPERIGRDFEAFITCWAQPYDDEVDVCDLGNGPQDAPRVLVVGDSHARVLFGAFRRLAEHGVVSVTATAKASCAWSTHPIEDKDPARIASCDTWRANLAEWLDEHAAEYDVVVTTAYSGRMVGPKQDRVDGLVEAWRPVIADGVPIVALRDNPRLEDDPDECLIATSPQDWEACDVARDDVVNQFDAFERAASRVDGVDFVDTWRYFCDDEVCPVVLGGVGVYRDYNHVSAGYSETLAPFLYREIARTGVLHP